MRLDRTGRFATTIFHVVDSRLEGYGSTFVMTARSIFPSSPINRPNKRFRNTCHFSSGDVSVTPFGKAIPKVFGAIALFLGFIGVTVLRDWYMPDMVLFHLPNPVRFGLIVTVTLMSVIMITHLASTALKTNRKELLTSRLTDSSLG